MTVTKTDLTSSIHNRLDLPKRQASRLVESLLENKMAPHKNLWVN